MFHRELIRRHNCSCNTSAFDVANKNANNAAENIAGSTLTAFKPSVDFGLRFVGWQVFVLFFLMVCAPAFADSGQLALPAGDLVAPEVVHEPGTEPLVPGKPFTISVKATDNVGVKKVLLFYRPIGGGDYKRVAVPNISGSRYSVTLPGTEIIAPGIEYYVQTEDLAGNTLLTGYSFSPLVVKVSETDAASPPIASGQAAGTVADAFNADGGASAEPLWKNKWLWIGVAAVAGVALASGSSDSGGTSGKTTDVTVSACFPQTPTSCP